MELLSQEPGFSPVGLKKRAFSFNKLNSADFALCGGSIKLL